MKRKQLFGVVYLIALALVTVGLTSAIAGRGKKTRAPQALATTPTIQGMTLPPGEIYYTPERLRARQLDDFNRERGTVVSFDPDVVAMGPADRQLLNDYLTAFDPEPIERCDYFQWLDQPGMKRRGWHAHIKDVSDIPTGMLVQIQVSPYLVRDIGGIPGTSNIFTEFYNFDGTRLDYLGFSATPPIPAHILFID